MKKSVLTSVVIILALFATEFGIAQSNQHEAIKKTIFEETEAFFDRDIEKWKSGWMHNDKISRTVIRNSFHSQVNGWNEVEKMMDEYFTLNPEPVPVKIEQLNFIIHENDNLAWVEFEERLDFEEDEDDNYMTQQQRTLIKDNGEWKLVGQVTVNSASFTSHPKAIEYALNTTGYKLLGENKIQEAIEVFETNSRLFPESWNVFDSLGEAYAEAGETEKAIANYKKSIDMNPENEHGKEILQTLRE